MVGESRPVRYVRGRAGAGADASDPYNPCIFRTGTKQQA